MFLAVLRVLFFTSLYLFSVVSIAGINPDKYALIIGNSDYKYFSSLDNPKNDATDMAKALKKLDFNVTLVKNGSKEAILKASRDFANQIKTGGIGLFYYAGHGVQIKGKNYIIPVDANIATEGEVQFEGFNIDRLLAAMESADNAMNIMILDACRNNPLPKKARAANALGGLAEIKAPKGTLIAFATAPGSTALDGEGRNSPYTKNLLKQLTVTGLTLEQVLKRTLKGVSHDTQEQQVPWYSSSFSGDFYFIPPPVITPIISTPTVIKKAVIIPIDKTTEPLFNLDDIILMISAISAVLLGVVGVKFYRTKSQTISPQLQRRASPVPADSIDPKTYIINKSVMHLVSANDHSILATLPPDKPFIIGRSANKTSLKLEAMEISGTHLNIEWNKENDSLIIEDLASSNGSWLNDERLIAHQKTLLTLNTHFYLAKKEHAFYIAKA